MKNKPDKKSLSKSPAVIVHREALTSITALWPAQTHSEPAHTNTGKTLRMWSRVMPCKQGWNYRDYGADQTNLRSAAMCVLNIGSRCVRLPLKKTHLGHRLHPRPQTHAFRVYSLKHGVPQKRQKTWQNTNGVKQPLTVTILQNMVLAMIRGNHVCFLAYIYIYIYIYI